MHITNTNKFIKISTWTHVYDFENALSSVAQSVLPQEDLPFPIESSFLNMIHFDSLLHSYKK